MKDSKKKKNGLPCCPGCGKHCPMGATRCKYGNKYFAKSFPKEKPSGWKTRIEKGGLIFLLLKVVKQVKKGLKKEQTSEEVLLSRLNPSEKEALESILKKLYAK